MMLNTGQRVNGETIETFKQFQNDSNVFDDNGLRNIEGLPKKKPKNQIYKFKGNFIKKKSSINDKIDLKTPKKPKSVNFAEKVENDKMESKSTNIKPKTKKSIDTGLKKKSYIFKSFQKNKAKMQKKKSLSILGFRTKKQSLSQLLNQKKKKEKRKIKPRNGN
jgi:hypothetical protein